VSLARVSGPASVVAWPLWMVRGRRPCDHVRPPFVLVSQPIADAPPSKTRPTCWVATIVCPNDPIDGSSSLAW